MPAKKLLIMSVSAGMGHVRAAEAIRACALQHPEVAEVVHLDAMDFVTAGFRKVYTDFYVKLVDKAPTLWGYLYNHTHEAKADSSLERLRRALERMNARALRRQIRALQPDAIICTHFLPAEMLARQIHLGELSCPVWVQVTDFDLHRLWVHQGMAGYFAANDEVAFRMQAQGIEARNIEVTGIPIMPAFGQALSRSVCAAEYGLDPAQPTLLLMGGGAGVGSLETIAQRLMRLEQRFQLLALAGRNQQALASLQAHVAPFPSEQAVQEVESALGRPWQQVFAHFDMEALAAASIAQIHRAALLDGTEVVVKIRRPGAAEQAETDMRILRRLVLVIQWFVPSLRRWGLAAIVDEVAANFRYEMDLSREAGSVRRFADAWRGSPDIVIPDVVNGLCTSTVMVQQFSHGADLHGLPTAMAVAAAGKLVDSYVAQVFRDGFFHGDPHPGNVFVMDDGRICLHDFGIVGRVTRSMRRALVAFALAFVEQDADWVVDAWLDLGLVGEGTDRAVFVPVVRTLVADCAERPLKDWSLSDALSQLVAAGRTQDVRLPRDLLVLTRTLLLLEGTVRLLAPDFSIIEAISRHTATGIFDERKSAASQRLPYELGSAASVLPTLLARRLHSVLRQRELLQLSIKPDAKMLSGLDRLGRRIALALVTLGLYIASSLLMQHGVGPRWGDMPVLALLGYALAIRFTFSIARSCG